MTGKSLRELRDQIPAVGGGLENRLLELSVGITGDTLQQDIEAAALFLHEIYDALTAQADELATLRAENAALKDSIRKSSWTATIGDNY